MPVFKAHIAVQFLNIYIDMSGQVLTSRKKKAYFFGFDIRSMGYGRILVSFRL